MRGFVVILLTCSGLLGIPACAFLSASGPHPRELAGIWFDSTTATSTDSSFWILAGNGEQRIMRATVVAGANGLSRVERAESFGGQWWSVSGRMSDHVRRRICFTVRPRVEGSCYRFDVDTVMSGTTPLRRLRVYAYPINRPRVQPRNHVFHERPAIPR